MKSWYFCFYKITQSNHSTSKQHGHPKDDGLMDLSTDYIDLAKCGGKEVGGRGQAKAHARSLPESPPLTITTYSMK